jgi:hypothetical protein
MEPNSVSLERATNGVPDGDTHLAASELGPVPTADFFSRRQLKGFDGR